MLKWTIFTAFLSLSCTIIYSQCLPTPPLNTIWGATTGEGDFNGGLNGWSTTSPEDQGWAWTANGDCTSIFNQDLCNMQTPTICNGAAAINSARLDTEGNCQAICLSGLISPNIILTNQNTQHLSLQFNQTIRDFNSKYFLVVSYNNGIDWADTMILHQSVFRNQAMVPNQQMRIPLCNVPMNATQIRFQFLIFANYYFWGIDDVFLIEESYSDPTIEFTNYTKIPTFKSMVGIQDELPLFASIKNNGNTDAQNLELEATISKITLLQEQEITSELITKTELIKKSKSIATLPACQESNLIFFDPPFAPTIQEEGLYQLDFKVKSQENKILSNDHQFTRFLLTQNILSNGPTESEYGSAYLDNLVYPLDSDWGGTNYLTVGSCYTMPSSLNGKAVKFVFGLNDTQYKMVNLNANINCQVFKIIPKNNDDFLEPDEKFLIGNGYNAFGNPTINLNKNTINNRLYTFYLNDLNGDYLSLESGSTYLFCLNISANVWAPGVPLLYIKQSLGLNGLNWMDASETQKFLTNQGKHAFYSTYISDNKKSTESNTLQRILLPISTNLYSQVVFDDQSLSVGENKSEQLSVTIYPNPAIDLLSIASSEEPIEINIYDIQSNKKYFAPFRKEHNINVINFNSGLYIISIFDGKHFTFEKLIVKH